MGSGFTCRGFLERPNGPRLVLECLLNEISSLRLRTAPHFARKTPPLGAVHFAHVPSLSNELAKGLPCRKNPCCLRSHLRSSPFALSHLVQSWLRRPAPQRRLTSSPGRWSSFKASRTWALSSTPAPPNMTAPAEPIRSAAAAKTCGSRAMISTSCGLRSREMLLSPPTSRSSAPAEIPIARRFS